MSGTSVTKAFDDSGRQQLLESVIADYIRACDAGAAPDQQQILERHPEFADDLRVFFAQRDRLNLLAGPMRGFGDSLSASVGPGKHISYVGDYELLEEVARGGMGVVYKARQKTLGRIVAVKMMLAGRLSNEEDVKRFQIEAQAAASLQHPNIVPIHEVGQHEGLHYFSMDFVEGRSLSAVLRENVLPAKQAASYVRQMAAAIHYAHQQGTLHRDLKPSNVLIDSRDQVRITDFGLAMRVEGDSGLTQTGQIVGTPSYMPPEQAQGKRSLIGPGSDVYSLGAILYECLTGRAPFRADSVMKTIEQVIHREAASPRLLNAGIARDLETICLKCLEKEPHRRYGTAQLLADDLQRFLEDRPILARPVSTIERTWRWCRRNPAVASLLAAVALCMIIGTAVSSYFAVEASDRAKDERFQRRRADDKTALAERRREESDENARLAQRRLYVSDMNLAQAAWEDGRVGRVVELLEQHGPGTASENLRGFEWHYWDRLCHRDLFTRKHTFQVAGVTFNPDGKRFASVSADPFTRVGNPLAALRRHQSVKVWDTATGREVLALVGQPADAISLAYSPDGQTLAYGSYQSITVCDAEKGGSLMNLTGHTGWVSSVLFSPDGTRLASVSSSDGVKLWNRATGKELLSIKDAFGPIGMSPDGKLLASGGGGRAVNLWDTDTGKNSSALEGHTSSVSSIAFTLDGKRLASAGRDRTIRVWDVKSSQTLLTLKGHTDEVRSLVFSPDGLRLASGSNDQTVKLWDAVLGKELLTHMGHADEVQSVAFSPDGRRLASASADRTVKIWDATTSHLTFKLKTTKAEIVQYLAISPDEKRLAWSMWSGLIRVWDGDHSQEPLTFRGHTGQVPHVTFSRDGQWLASASWDMTAKIWDAATGQELHTLKGHTSHVDQVAFSPDGQRLATASWDFSVKLWDVANGQELRTLRGHTNAIFGVAFSADGRRLATASGDRTIKIWDPDSGQELLTLKSHEAAVESAAFSDDGHWLVSAGRDRSIKLWNAETGQVLRTLNGHTSEVKNVLFSPDGKRLVSASSDRTVKLWDIATGQETLTLKGHTFVVESIAMSRDGTRLVSSNHDLVKFWDTADHPHTKLGAPEALLAAQTARQRQVQGDNFRAEKQYGEAIACYREVLRLEPDNLTIANRLAWLLVVGPADVRDPAEAMKLAQQASATEPDNVNYRQTLGAAQFRSGQFDEGLKSLVRIAGANAKNIAWRAQNFFLQALCHEKLGQRQPAQAAYAKGLQLSKQNVVDSVHWHEARLLQAEVESSLGTTAPSD